MLHVSQSMRSSLTSNTLNDPHGIRFQLLKKGSRLKQVPL